MKSSKSVHSLSTFLLLAVLVGFVHPVEARVFNFKNETMAAYFRGSYGLSRLERTPYGEVSGPNTVFEGDEHIANFSGEIGFLANLMPQVSLRIGGEVIQARESAIEGQNSAGDKLFDLVSDVFVFAPTATIEWHFISGDWYRFSVFAGAAMASVSTDLEYTFTDAGNTAFGVTDYKEEGSALVMETHYGLQMEMIFVDTVTVALEAGFRSLPVNELEYKKPVTTITGTYDKGEILKDEDGSNRGLDMSGFYLGLAFRFYISFL